MKFITRAEARRRAERHVLEWMFRGATVRDGAEVGGNRYGVRREDTWVVYKKPSRLRIAVIRRGGGGVQANGPDASGRFGP